MEETVKNTEQNILLAAKTVFIRKGLDGARMQEIADEAGINKALLHYYYRSKEKLFDAVFVETFSQIAPRIAHLLQSDEPLLTRIKALIDNYIDMLSANPHIPMFILHEIHRNPDRIVNMLKSQGINPDRFAQSVRLEMESGLIRHINPYHLIPNVIALCIFPFVARPLLQGFIFANSNERFELFLSERKQEVYDFVKNALIR